MTALTTFPNEELLLRMPDGEALVQADTATGRAYVAVTADGFNTDYPLYYPHNDTVVWDNPEWFSDPFKNLVREIVCIREGRDSSTVTLHQALAARGWTSRKELDPQRRTIYDATGNRLGSFDAAEAWAFLKANKHPKE